MRFLFWRGFGGGGLSPVDRPRCSGFVLVLLQRFGVGCKVSASEYVHIFIAGKCRLVGGWLVSCG